MGAHEAEARGESVIGTLRWRAIYTDGTSLDSGRDWGRSTEEIDRTKLDRFEVFAHDLFPALSVRVPEGMELLARRRSFLSPGKGTRTVAIVVLENSDGNATAIWELPENGGPIFHRGYGAPGMWPIERAEA